MSDINQIIDHFQQSFDDRRVSGSERKALQEVLAESGINQQQREFLISKLYDIAATGLGKGNDHDVLDWLKRSNKLIMDTMAGGQRIKPAEVYFSPGKDPLVAIQNQITFASRGIDICVFTISDDRISDQLIQKHHSGMRIRVLTDNDKLYDAGSDIGKLARAGITVRVDETENHMHHKFAIFDGDTLLTGSYNWTRSAEARNNENILITHMPHVVKEFQDHFEKMWKEMPTYRER